MYEEYALGQLIFVVGMIAVIAMIAKIVVEHHERTEKVEREKEEFYWAIERVLTREVLKDFDIDLDAKIAEEQKAIRTLEDALKYKVAEKYFEQKRGKEEL